MKKTTLITYGTFDMFHIGHLNLLNRLSNLGDRLIVAVSTDEFNALKGRQFARSLYVVKEMQKGETFTEETIRSIRPGYGLHPKHLGEVLGKRASKHLHKGERLAWEMLV